MTDSNEWLRDKALADLYHRDTRSFSDGELERIEKVDDRDLMRASGSMHYLPSIEAMRRLRETIASEERAIRRLTLWLVILTVVLVILTLTLVGFAVYDWEQKRPGEHVPSVRSAAPQLRTVPVTPTPPSGSAGFGARGMSM